MARSTRHGATANKSAAGYLAGNLTPGQTYYFKARTFTPAHGEQQNALTSVWSAESAPVVVPAGNTPTPTRTRTSTPTATRTGGVTPSPTPTPTATGAPSQCIDLLRNGDFEAGVLSPWATYQQAGLGPGRGAGHGGWLGGAVNSIAELFQEVAIPASANLDRLAFWWRADAASAQPGDQLTLVIQYGEQADPAWTGTAGGPLGEWRRQEVDLGAYRGKRVLVTFHAHNDAGVATTFRVDDVEPCCLRAPALPAPDPAAPRPDLIFGDDFNEDRPIRIH